jgi:putative hydrolase of the HAD superfamily
MKGLITDIILDFGGVLYDIDYQKTADAFHSIGFEKFDKWYSQAKQHELFDLLETGKISDVDFYNEVRRISQLSLTDSEIQNAWNALLIGLPIKRIELIEKLSTKYNVYLLSNTNIIHANEFKNEIDKIYGWNKYHQLFKKLYLSHELQMRKPHIETFEHVIDKNNLNPEKTLFVDDSFQHIEGAQKAGIKTYFLNLKEGDNFESLFQKLF